MSTSIRIAIRVEYLGNKFCGSQLQTGDRTVQLELERALNVLFRTGAPRQIKANFSGRTDTRVHALGQVAHFDLPIKCLDACRHEGGSGFLSSEFLRRYANGCSTKQLDLTGVQPNTTGTARPDVALEAASDMVEAASDVALEATSDAALEAISDVALEAASEAPPNTALNETSSAPPNMTLTAPHNEKLIPSTVPELDELSLKNMCWALNGILPQDVSITRAQVVPDSFNARFSATRRSYVYRILNRPQRSALRHNTQYFLQHPLNLEAMQTAAACLLGKNDFAAFKSSNKEKVSTICTVDRAEILNKGEGELEFWISADHFVYNMVRIIVGTLIEVGLGKRAPSSLSEALAGKDRHLAGPTAPPWGLCLYSVDYPAEFNLFQTNSQTESGE